MIINAEEKIQIRKGQGVREWGIIQGFRKDSPQGINSTLS